MTLEATGRPPRLARCAARGALVFLVALLGAAPPAAADEAAGGKEIVSLRFSWPTPARARVTYRRTRLRTGEQARTFTARYEALAEATDEGLLLTTSGTAWRGHLPCPRPLAREAIRASQRLVQHVRADGQFVALDGVEALRPVLARVLDDAKVPADQAQRAVALSLAATRAEAEELWNLAVGFWTGADLRLGQTYAMQSEGEVPLVPGARASQAVEFNVRRRVPCSAGERGARCVEAVLRSTPDRAALERAAPQLLARLLPSGAEAQPAPAAELTAESELVLVTDPATLLPRRLVWTKTVRLGAREEGSADAAEVDRAEYDWRWLPRASPTRIRPKPQASAPSARRHTASR